MTTVIYQRPDGSVAEHRVEDGLSVMQAAVAQGEDGIVAECGGSMMCATCHVYVDEAFYARLPQPSEDEDEMLDCTASPRRPTSRLSCQLIVSPALEGLTVQIPPVQI